MSCWIETAACLNLEAIFSGFDGLFVIHHSPFPHHIGGLVLTGRFTGLICGGTYFAG
jgi:hypothetical protein